MEALWVHQWHNVVNESLLERMLRSPDVRARAAAARVLCYWRDRVSQPLEKLKSLATDEHPRVRLEAVRACSFFEDSKAADIALLSLKQPSDYYRDYTLKETLRQLEPLWREAIAEGRPLAEDNPQGVDYILGQVSSIELLKLPHTPAVLQAWLTRPGIPDANHLEALEELAFKHESTAAAGLVNVIENLAGNIANTARDLARLLHQQSPAALRACYKIPWGPAASLE